MSLNYMRQSPTRTKIASPPKVSPSGQRAARHMLLLCTTASVSSASKDQISQIMAGPLDWSYLLNLSEVNGVAPLISYNLVNDGFANKIPQPYLEELNNIYSVNLYRNIILSHELKKVLAVFSQHGIRAIVLKGTVLAEQLYGNPGLRVVSDMDILVSPVKAALSGSLLSEMGYRQMIPTQAWDHPFHEVPYRKQAQFPFSIELHWNLDDQRLVAVPQQEIWQRAQLLQRQEESTLVLSPEDNLLFLSDHLPKHFTQTLKYLCDIAELIKKSGNTLDWGYITAAAYSWQIEAAVYYSLNRAKDLLEAPVPEGSLKQLKPGAWRWWVLELLVGKEILTTPSKEDKLREETSVLTRSLMMKHFHQTLSVLSRYRSHKISVKRAAWFRTAVWIILVFGVALARNLARFFSR